MKPLIYIMLCILLVGCQQSERTITVSAAMSLSDALLEIEREYTKQHPDVNIDFNFAGSGTLREQLLQGAPVDMYISASIDDFNTIIDHGLISKDDSVKLLTNHLVLITHKDNNVDGLAQLYNHENKIAIGNPDTVPAGRYSQNVLNTLNHWDALQTQLILTEDVRTVLNYVENQSVEMGFVYHTDALTSDSVKIIETYNIEESGEIIYSLGIMSSATHNAFVQEFYTYLQSENAQEVFEKYGFATDSN